MNLNNKYLNDILCRFKPCTFRFPLISAPLKHLPRHVETSPCFYSLHSFCASSETQTIASESAFFIPSCQHNAPSLPPFALHTLLSPSHTFPRLIMTSFTNEGSEIETERGERFRDNKGFRERVGQRVS